MLAIESCCRKMKLDLHGVLFTFFCLLMYLFIDFLIYSFPFDEQNKGLDLVLIEFKAKLSSTGLPKMLTDPEPHATNGL